MTNVVIASGQSVTQAMADRVRHLPTVAAGDGYQLAPWARAIVACDRGWWMEKSKHLDSYAGERWSPDPHPGPFDCIHPLRNINTNTNSGLLGLDYWVRRGAKRILLLGIDMQGTHFFGRHEKLQNTPPGQFAIFIWQFDRYAGQMAKDVEVINCSPISALTCFPKMSLDDALLASEAAA